MFKKIVSLKDYKLLFNFFQRLAGGQKPPDPAFEPNRFSPSDAPIFKLFPGTAVLGVQPSVAVVKPQPPKFWSYL